MVLQMWSLCGVFITTTIFSYYCVSASVIVKRHYDFENRVDIEVPPMGGKEGFKGGFVETVERKYVVKPGLGDLVRLECKVNSEEMPVVNWYKLGGKGKGDSILYVNSLKMMNSENPLYYRTQIKCKGRHHDLVIHDVQASDAGEYRCTLVQSKPSSVRHILKIAEQISIVP